jgi:predicted choloylglycine hydrolase
MAYNVSLVDRDGVYAVAYLRPGSDPIFVRELVATNHQRTIEWPEYVAAMQSRERKRCAQAALRDMAGTADLIDHFLQPPLFATEYERGHGTLYTVAFRPAELSAEVHWPGASVHQTIEDFVDREFDVPYVVGGPPSIGS